MAARADCDSLGRRARQGCFVAVLGEVTADAALTFRRRGVEGFFRRVVVAFPRQDRVCALVLGARVVLQHAGDRLPSGGEVDGACFAGGTLVPQLREPTTDVPVLFQDRFVDLGLAAVSNEDRLEAVPAFKRFGRVGPVTGCGSSPGGRRGV
jgi:hypothetical protein